MPTDLSGITNAITGFIRDAERVEVDLKALAHARARSVYASAYRRLPAAGEHYATGKTRAALHVVDDSAHKQFRVEVADIPGRDPMVPVYLEFGTVGMFARPFLRPALEENRPEYLRDAEALITKLEHR